MFLKSFSAKTIEIQGRKIALSFLAVIIQTYYININKYDFDTTASVIYYRLLILYENLEEKC